jgi:phytanoyl-CoA hydroxylase
MACNIPFIDVTKQISLTSDQIHFFQAKGFLVLRNALCSDELQLLQNETHNLIAKITNGSDYWFNDEIPVNWYKLHPNALRDTEYNHNDQSLNQTNVKKGVPFRIEYPLDKSDACKILLGHSFVLNAIKTLISPNFIPTWDSLVFKYPGDGVPIKWHRDASAASVDATPAIDVGFYLDEANATFDNCLYVVPGSHHWNDTLASSMIEYLIDGGFKKVGAVPVEVQPGDVIMHNILILHGSPACRSPLRRTIYYEFRAIEQELRLGPHIPEYIPLKQRIPKNDRNN